MNTNVLHINTSVLLSNTVLAYFVDMILKCVHAATNKYKGTLNSLLHALQIISEAIMML